MDLATLFAQTGPPRILFACQNR